jgi:hypothetical protein
MKHAWNVEKFLFGTSFWYYEHQPLRRIPFISSANGSRELRDFEI